MHQTIAIRPQLDLAFAGSAQGTFLDRRLFRWPYTIARTFRLDRTPAGLLTVIVQSVSGAIQADDRLMQRCHVGPDAMAHVTTPAAAAVHRAPHGLEAVEDVQLSVDDGGYLEYLPEPRILFRDACLTQRLRLRLAAAGTAVIADGFTTHDPTGGENSFRHFASEILIERPDGRLLAVERFDLPGLPRRRGRRQYFSAYGTLIVATPSEHLTEHLDRDIAQRTAGIAGLYHAVTALPNFAGASLRVAAHDGRRLRQGLAAGWFAARRFFFGADPAPRWK
jgi:urease accessory protein